jgi:hypothetical protein
MIIRNDNSMVPRNFFTFQASFKDIIQGWFSYDYRIKDSRLILNSPIIGPFKDDSR